MVNAFYKEEEEGFVEHLRRTEAGNTMAFEFLDKQISELRSRYAENPTPELERHIQCYKAKILAHQRYFDAAEANLKNLVEEAHVLREFMENEELETFSWWKPKTVVARFESGEMNFKVFRQEKNIRILREAYEVHGPRDIFPTDGIILTIAEEIIACKYEKPEEGDLFKESFGGLKK